MPLCTACVEESNASGLVNGGGLAPGQTCSRCGFTAEAMQGGYSETVRHTQVYTFPMLGKTVTCSYVGKDPDPEVDRYAHE